MSLRRHFTMRSTYGTLCAALLASALAPSVASADKPKVLVLPYSPLYDSIPRATGEQIAKTLEDGLRGKSAIELLRAPSEGDGSGAPAKAATAEQKAGVLEGLAELDRGRTLLARKRVKPALDAFTKAIERMVTNHAALEEVEPLVEAYLKRGAALFLMGREDDAAKGPVVEALHLDPGMRVQAGEEYGAPYVALIEKVREEIAGTGLGSLRVDTTPPGALIWVDGKEALTSPVQVSGLVPGTHYVKIKLPSTDAYTEQIRVQKDQLFRISPDEGPAKKEGPVGGLVSYLSNNQIDTQAKGQIKQIAQTAGADIVVIGGTFAEGAGMGIVTFLYSVKDDSLASLQRVSLNREMLGATIEINKVSTELLERMGSLGEGLALPAPLAREAKAGAEEINEVDFTVDFAALKGGESKDARPIGPVRPERSGPRRPIGPRQPIGGGGAAPTFGETSLSMEEEAPAPVQVVEEPALAEPDFLDFKDQPAQPSKEPALDDRALYSYSGGVSIADEVPLDDRPQIQPKSGLFSKWWFWTGAGLIVGGAVATGVAMGGGDDGAVASGKW